MGFDGKMTLHPNQLPVLHKAMCPNPLQLEEARAILKAAQTEKAGAFKFRGRMVSTDCNLGGELGGSAL